MVVGLDVGIILFKLVIIIISAKLVGWLFEKIKQPAVLGELLVGVLLGPSLFNLISPEGEHILIFLAEIGAILLLFHVGLESNIYQLVKVGLASTLVAIIGIVVPFALGFFYFFLSGHSSVVSIFVGATMVATSVGVTMRVLSDMKKVNANESKIILGAAVIDDILGLIILAVVVGIAATGAVSVLNITKITVMSIVFLVGSIIIGIKFVPSIYSIVHKLEIEKTYVISAFAFAVLLAIAAHSIGLATIVGAFAAGLILERTEHKEHFEQKMRPVADLFVPVFFVMAGVALDVHTLLNVNIIAPIVIISAIAIIGKLVAGIGAVKAKANKLIIGIGMVPRGEVGLIFVSYGLTHAIFTSELYSLLVVVIMVTTFFAPPCLSMMKDKFYTAKEKTTSA